MTPAAVRAVQTLRVFMLADIIANSRRVRGSRGRSVRLRVPPIALPKKEWDRVAQHVLERRPNWSSVELVDVRGQVVAACERHVAGE
jgi:hypothetical protein